MTVADMIVAEAQRQGVDPPLAIEVASRESRLNPNVSDGAAREIGVFQILPTSAPGANLRDLNTNIQTGVSILRQNLSMFGDPLSAVAAYNCGQGCVRNAKRDHGADWFSYIPSSTREYATDILNKVQTSYTPVFNPTFAAPFVPSAGMMDLTPMQAPAVSSGSIWTTLMVAAAIIFGIGYVLDEV